MKIKNTQEKEYINDIKRQYIKEDLFACYKKIQKDNNININSLIKRHKRLINSLELIGNKKKYKSLTYLEHYRNTKNKVAALMILTCTMNNMSGVSV